MVHPDVRVSPARAIRAQPSAHVPLPHAIGRDDAYAWKCPRYIISPPFRPSYAPEAQRSRHTSRHTPGARSCVPSGSPSRSQTVSTPTSRQPIAPHMDIERFLNELHDMATASGAFQSVTVTDGALRCAAKGSSAEAWYSIVPVRSGTAVSSWWVRLATPDRWLSESIEADLMHYGDPIEELIEEELVDMGHDAATDGAMPPVKHFRSEEKLYTFESPLPIDAALTEGEVTTAARVAGRFLLAYEAAFRHLGDMSGAEGDA